MLLTTDTDPDDIENALPTTELARKMLLGTRARRVLLMLDICYSGHGGNELTAAAITAMTTRWGEDHGSGLVVITSAQPAEQAQTVAFPQLLRDAVHSLPAAGYNPETLPLDSVVTVMNAHAAKPGYQTTGFSVAELTGEVPSFCPTRAATPGMTEVDLAIQRPRVGDPGRTPGHRVPDSGAGLRHGRRQAWSGWLVVRRAPHSIARHHRVAPPPRTGPNDWLPRSGAVVTYPRPRGSPVHNTRVGDTTRTA